MAKRILSNISISKKLILIFLAIVLFSTSISGYLGYLNSKKIVEERIQDQLLSVLVLKENSMENFFKLLREDIENFAGNKEIKAYFEEFHFSTNKVNPELEELKEEEIELYFREELIHHAHFLEIFLLDVNGKIDISTEANQKGKIKSSDDIFLKGKERTYIKNIYYSVSRQEPTLTISTPVLAENNKVLGVLVGRVNLNELSAILEENSGLGKTGETYLVNKFNYATTNLLENSDKTLKTIITTDAVQHCLNRENANLHDSPYFMSGYKNYNNDPVIGSHRWIDNREVCIITEINQAEAFTPIYRLRKIVIYISFILTFVTFIIAIIFSRTIRDPIQKLQKSAEKIATGDLDSSILIESNDEIWYLAKTLDDMRIKLKETLDEIRKHQNELHTVVNEKTEDLNKKLQELEDTKLAIINILEDTDYANKDLMNTRDALKNNIKELKAMDKTKDEFLSITAHELKTPLTSIKGFIGLLKNEKVMQNMVQRNKYFDIIIEDTKRLGQYSAKNQLLYDETISKVVDVNPSDTASAILRYNTFSEEFEVTVHWPGFGWFPSFNNQDFLYLKSFEGYYFDQTGGANWTHDPEKN